MSKAYRLHEQLADDPCFGRLALDITKDIHEIKKDQLRVLRGLEQGIEEGYNHERMRCSDLMHILKSTTHIPPELAGTRILIEVSDDFYTSEPYRLLSIVRNLVTNAIEAIPENRGSCTVSVAQWRDGERIRFRIEDNCGGMTERAEKNAFHVGYSTKFNAVTGDMNRGVGLFVVKSIVDDLNGTMTLQTRLGEGTTFSIEFPSIGVEVFEE